MDLLKDLNPQQRKAVTASEGAALILAGPGSGKTRILTRRAAWLVLERDIRPWRIMAVTFTNKAAREMRNRLERLLGHAHARDLTLGTFHATCARILRREAEAAGIPRNYVIFDADDQRRLVRRILRDLDIDDKQYRPSAVHSAISHAKNELIPPAAYQPTSYFGEIVKRVYEHYDQRLRASGGLDFDDLLAETVRLFRENPEVRRGYQERYLHVLVDEFQDTNMAQYVLLRQLSARHHNLFAVADEDQSIYRWRGADYRNIWRLREDHPQLEIYLLERNYRSTQNILDAAQAIIRHNPNRTDKKLFTQRGPGLKVMIHEAYDQDEEAQFVVNTIRRLTRSEGYELGDFAVMYRTNAQSRALEEAFLRIGLPYRLVGATRFYARREVKDLIAFLRVIHNPSDTTSLSRIINVPRRGIGRKTVMKLEKAARSAGEPLWWAVKGAATDQEGPSLSTRATNVVTSFHNMIQGWIESRDGATVSQLMDRVLEDTNYEAYLRDGTDEGEDRWNNVQELRAVAADYSDLTLSEFLADVALVSDVDNLTRDVDAPTLLTLHSAKGLEFPVVFITGMEEGLLPHSRSLDDPEELAEERRLMYVGVTRAEDRLYLTYAFRRTRYGTTEPSVASRFLEDIPDRLTQGAHAHRVQKVTQWKSPAAPTTPAQTPSRFSAGDRVTHDVFGPGVVLESKAERNGEKVTVAFDEAGLKKIMSDYLELA
jgi:DNA helicase-2/ATP-dependent DNA helicase PcrA